jgi:hypothetical protein
MCREGKTVETFLFPYSDQSSINVLYEQAEVKNIKYSDEGVVVEACVDEKTKGMIKKYLK